MYNASGRGGDRCGAGQPVTLAKVVSSRPMKDSISKEVSQCSLWHSYAHACARTRVHMRARTEFWLDGYAVKVLDNYPDYPHLIRDHSVEKNLISKSCPLISTCM
jgi:hypothetical protein